MSVMTTVESVLEFGTRSTVEIRDEEPPYWSGFPLALRMFLFHIVGMLAIALNVLNLLVLRRVNCYHDATKLFLRIMSVIDIASGFLAIITENVINWMCVNPPPPYCEIVLTTNVCLVFISLYMLSCLSLDRLVAITRPLRYPTLMNKTRAGIIATLSITFACLIGMGILSKNTPIDNVYYDQNFRFCSISSFSSTIQFALAMGGTIVFILLLCTTYVNMRLLWIACKQVRRHRLVVVQPIPTAKSCDTATSGNHQLDDGVEKPAARISRFQEMKALRTVLVMTAAMYLAFLPMTIHVTMFAIGLGTFGKFYEFISWLMILNNSWFNPATNFVLNSNYRLATFKLFKSK